MRNFIKLWMSSGQLLYNWPREAERPKLKSLHEVELVPICQTGRFLELS